MRECWGWGSYWGSNRGLNSGLNGGNILQGAAIGGAIGAGVGLIQDGIDYAKQIKAARRNLIASGYEPKGSVTMSDASLQDFVGAHDELSSLYNTAGSPDLVAGRAPSFSKYNIGSDGLFINAAGQPTAGVTSSLGGKISVHVAPARFSSALKLYTTVGHELNHAVDLFTGNFASLSALGGRQFTRNISEFRAHGWSLNVGRQIGFETARHQAALSLYRSSMSAGDWANYAKLLSIFGF